MRFITTMCNIGGESYKVQNNSTHEMQSALENKYQKQLHTFSTKLIKKLDLPQHSMFDITWIIDDETGVLSTTFISMVHIR